MRHPKVSNMNKVMGTQIRVAREKKKLSQQELAEQLGITAATVSRWENAERNISAKLFFTLSNLLGVDLNRITVEPTDSLAESKFSGNVVFKPDKLKAIILYFAKDGASIVNIKRMIFLCDILHYIKMVQYDDRGPRAMTGLVYKKDGTGSLILKDKRHGIDQNVMFQDILNNGEVGLIPSVQDNGVTVQHIITLGPVTEDENFFVSNLLAGELAILKFVKTFASTSATPHSANAQSDVAKPQYMTNFTEYMASYLMQIDVKCGKYIPYDQAAKQLIPIINESQLDETLAQILTNQQVSTFTPQETIKPKPNLMKSKIEQIIQQLDSKPIMLPDPVNRSFTFLELFIKIGPEFAEWEEYYLFDMQLDRIFGVEGCHMGRFSNTFKDHGLFAEFQILGLIKTKKFNAIIMYSQLQACLTPLGIKVIEAGRKFLQQKE